MNGHVTGTESRGIYVALRVRASGVSAVVDELHSLVIGSCGSALETCVICCFGSRQFSSLHAICGAHVPGTCPSARGAYSGHWRGGEGPMPLACAASGIEPVTRG